MAMENLAHDDVELEVVQESFTGSMDGKVSTEDWSHTGLTLICRILGGAHSGALVTMECDLPEEQNDELAVQIVGGKSLAGRRFWVYQGKADWSSFLD